MATAISPGAGRCYGVARVCQVWDLPRSSFYAACRWRPESAQIRRMCSFDGRLQG